MKRDILVIGSTGAVGSLVVAELARLTYRQLRTECLWSGLDLSAKTKSELLRKVRRRLCCAIAAREETAAG